MTSSEIEEPFSPEEKGTSVRLEPGTLRVGFTHSSLIMEHDLKRMDSMDPTLSKAGICRANPAFTRKEDELTLPLYRETGLTMPAIQGRVHEVGYVDASQEEVRSSVFHISNYQSTLVVLRREERKYYHKLAQSTDKTVLLFIAILSFFFFFFYPCPSR